MTRAGIRKGTARRSALALVVALATLVAGTASPGAQATSSERKLEPGALVRAEAIRARLDARYRPSSSGGLAVTESTSTGVLESYTLLSPDLTGSRVVSAANGIYYAICPVRATCPFPAARYARPAADYVARRLALQLALRTFLETSAELVVVSLPTPSYEALVVQRDELARDFDLAASARALGGDPSRALSVSVTELVDRLTRPRVFVALGLEPTPRGGASWAGMPHWLVTDAGRALLGTTSATPVSIRFELVLDGAGRSSTGSFHSAAPFCTGGRVVDLGRGVSGRWIGGLRRFTCSDGSGGVTVRTWLMGMDEDSRLEDGAWKIVAGTGAYSTLRGVGAYASVVVDAEGGTTSRETWAGDAGFDAVAPRVQISAISTTRTTRGWHVVRVAFSARDREHSASIDFLVSASNRFLLAARSGTTASDAASVVLRVRPGSGGRAIRVKIEASDRVGNATTVVRTLTLPGSRDRSSRTPDSFPRRVA